MSIKLITGQRISLKKEAPGLKYLLFGLGWDLPEKKGLKKLFQSDFDLDSSVLCLGSNNKLQKSTDVVYYGTPKHPSEAIAHLGDELTGAGDEEKAKIIVQSEVEPKRGERDKEQILINLPQIPSEIVKLVFFVNIYEGLSRRQNFGQIRDAYVYLMDLEEETEIAYYDLSQEDYHNCTGILIAEVYREGKDDQWQLLIVGKGVQVASLQEFVGRYS
jgi:stress response protein SCP2